MRESFLQVKTRVKRSGNFLQVMARIKRSGSFHKIKTRVNRNGSFLYDKKLRIGLKGMETFSKLRLCRV